MREFGRNHWGTIPLVRSASGSPNEHVINFDHVGVTDILEKIPRCDAIVHMATHVDFRSDAKLEPFISTNVLATASLSTVARVWQARLIFLSGTIVFGNKLHITSELEPSPDTPYGYAKRVAEQILEASDVSATVLRPAGIFGYRGPNHLGINRAIEAATDKHEAPTLIGTGSAKRNYIFVDDLAASVVLCAKTDISGTHLVAGKETSTIKEMIEMIGEVLAPGTQINMISGDESTDMTVESSKKLPPGRSFRDALESIKEQAALG